MFIFDTGTTDLNDSYTASCSSKLLIPETKRLNSISFPSLCRKQRTRALCPPRRSLQQWKNVIEHCMVWCEILGKCIWTLPLTAVPFSFFSRPQFFDVPKGTPKKAWFLALASFLRNLEMGLLELNVVVLVVTSCWSPCNGLSNTDVFEIRSTIF